MFLTLSTKDYLNSVIMLYKQHGYVHYGVCSGAIGYWKAFRKPSHQRTAYKEIPTEKCQWHTISHLTGPVNRQTWWLQYWIC